MSFFKKLYFCIMYQEITTKAPLLSFIITCFNKPASQIAECINNILKLSLRDEEREIIVVDDGSQEYILDSLTNIADNIIYIRQRTAGTGAARNTGLRMATGSYIQFIDGEDKLISEAYEHCIDLVRYNEPDIVIFNSSNSEQGKNDYAGEAPTDGAEYLKNNNLEISPWGYIFSSRILIGLRFTPGLYAEEEEFTTLLFLRAEKIYSTSSVAYYDRLRKEDKIDRKDKRLVMKRLNDIEQILIHMNDLSTAMSVMDKTAMQRRLAQLTMNYIIKTIRWTRSAKQLDTRIQTLEEHGLFPLPDKHYSKKYVIFSKLSRNSFVRKCLSKVLS